MSSVNAVLLSYGASGAPGIPPFPSTAPAFTISNIDTLTIAFEYGCPTGRWYWEVTDTFPESLLVAQSGSKFAPIPDPMIYGDSQAVDYPTTTTLCALKDGDLFCEPFSTESTSVPVGVNFANYFSDNPGEATVDINVTLYLVDEGSRETPIGSYCNVLMTGYTGGTYERNEYEGNVLTQVGGVAAVPALYTEYYDPDGEYSIPSPASSVARVFIRYVLETKTAYIWVANQFPTA